MQTIYFIGMVFGVMTFGILSDIIGRKKVTRGNI
jgi:MFS family permease